MFAKNQGSLMEDIKMKGLKIADEILKQTDNKKEINHYENSIIEATKRADSDKIKNFDKSCYTLVNSVMSECNVDPLEMSVMQFYQLLEDLKKRNSKLKSKTK